MSNRELPERSRVVRQHLRNVGIEADIQELPVSTRTAAAAAEALGCDVGAIASSLLFIADDEPILVMTSGRHRVDTQVLKTAIAATDVQMATAAQVRQVTGQAIGGVAPTGHPAPVRTVVDETLSDHETIWTAGGTPNTVVPLTFASLLQVTNGARVPVSLRGT